MEQRQLGDASVQQKTNVSSLFETTTTTTTRDAKKDNEKEDQENELEENKLPPSHTAEDILGAEGISETDLYRFLEDLDEMAPTIPDQYTEFGVKNSRRRGTGRKSDTINLLSRAKVHATNRGRLF